LGELNYDMMVTRFDVKFCKTRISEYLLAEI